MVMLDPMFLSEVRPFDHSTFPTSADPHLFQTPGGSNSAHSRGSTASPSNADGDFRTTCLSSSMTGVASSLLTSSLSTAQSYSSIVMKIEDDRDSIPSSVSHTDSTEQMGYVCHDCGGTFPDRSVLSRHRISHLASKYVCPMCSRPFARDDKLKRHIRCVHSSERPYKCEVCSKAFARKDKLQEHARHHNRDITFTCSICSEVFVMRSHLNRHLRGVHKMKLCTSTPVVEDTESRTKASLSGNRSAFTPVNNVFPAHVSASATAVFTPTTTNVSATNQPDKSSKPRRRSTTQRFYQTRENTTSTTNSLRSPFDMRPSSLSAFSFPSSYGSDAPFFLGFAPLGSNPGPSLASAIPNRGTQHTSSDLSTPQRFPAYIGGEALYRNQSANQIYSQQPPTHPPHSAWSAAMAASLFRPGNYVGWWPQANTNLMLPYASSCTHNATAHATERPSSEPSASTVSHYPHMTNTFSLNTEGSQPPDPNSSVPNTPFSSYNLTGSYSGNGGSGISESSSSNSCAGITGSAPAPAHMLASLPTFAQAMYYQAASWVANQNGDAQGSGGLEPSGAPRFPTPYFSAVPTPHNH